MNEHLMKVANDLQRTYDQYRGRVDRYNEDYSRFSDAMDDYQEAKPGWENPVRAAIPIIGAGAGMLAGMRLGNPHGVAEAGGVIGGMGGLGAGLAGQHGVRALLDRQNPERRDLRSVRNDAADAVGYSHDGLVNSQEILKHQGRLDPAALYPMLQGDDPYDRMIESDIHQALVRDQRLADERNQLQNDAMRASIEKDYSKATKNHASAYQKLQ